MKSYISTKERRPYSKKGLSEEFQEIFALNQARCPEVTYELDPESRAEVLEKYDLLVYRYEKKYEPVSFNLADVTKKDPRLLTFWASPQYPPASFYGFPGAPTELLAYLESLK